MCIRDRYRRNSDALTEADGGDTYGTCSLLGLKYRGAFTREIYSRGSRDTEGCQIIVEFVYSYLRCKLYEYRVTGVSHRLLEILGPVRIVASPAMYPLTRYDYGSCARIRGIQIGNSCLLYTSCGIYMSAGTSAGHYHFNLIHSRIFRPMPRYIYQNSCSKHEYQKRISSVAYEWKVDAGRRHR